jgi:hypothetical protein
MVRDKEGRVINDKKKTWFYVTWNFVYVLEN